MTHSEKVRKWLAGREAGVEIGAFKTPIPGIAPLYVDCFEAYAGEECLLDLKGTACDLPFIDSSLDYVATSHVLEHVANPGLALSEWARVLKPGGIIYSVIPDKRVTWDRLRATTTGEHVIDDFRSKTTQSDSTHIDEFIDGIVWSEYAPDKGEAEREKYRHLLKESVKAGLEVNIHFHTFEPGTFPALIEKVNSAAIVSSRLKLLDIVEHFPADVPNGFLAVLGRRKECATRAGGWAGEYSTIPSRPLKSGEARGQALRAAAAHGPLAARLAVWLATAGIPPLPALRVFRAPR